MYRKKLAATALIISLLGSNTMPMTAMAQTEKKSMKFFLLKTRQEKQSQNKLIKSQVTEYKFDYVNMDWWKKFNDDYLDEYISKAIENNLDLKIATLKVEEYNQLVKVQFANELPSGTVGFMPNIAKMPDSTSSSGLFAFPLLVNYEADIFLKNHDKTKSAKKNYESSLLDEKAAYISIVSAVGSTYFNIVKLDKLVDVQREIVSSRKEIYSLMKKRNEQGITSTADLLKADKSFVSAKNDLIELQKTRTILLNQLSVLIGDSPANTQELKRISYKEVEYKLQIPDEINSEIITQRPDYMRAEKQVEKAGLDVKIAKKEFLPNFSIMGLLFFNANNFGKSFNWSNALAAFGGSALFPFFSGGAKVANLKLKKNAYEQILQNYFKTNLVAIQEVNDALSTLKLDNEKYINNVAQREMENKDYKYNVSKFEQGIISKLDLIQRKENLLVMDKLVATSKMDCAVDYIGLYKAVGNKLN